MEKRKVGREPVGLQEEQVLVESVVLVVAAGLLWLWLMVEYVVVGAPGMYCCCCCWNFQSVGRHRTGMVHKLDSYTDHAHPSLVSQLLAIPSTWKRRLLLCRELEFPHNGMGPFRLFQLFSLSH